MFLLEFRLWVKHFEFCSSPFDLKDKSPGILQNNEFNIDNFVINKNINLLKLVAFLDSFKIVEYKKIKILR